MAHESHYQLAGKGLEKVEKNLDTPERVLAASQVDATLAVAGELALLRHEMSRVANALETGVPEQIADAANLLREQIRAFVR